MAFKFNQMAEALRKSNPLIRQHLEEKELQQVKAEEARTEKRRKIKARAERDRLAFRLAHEKDHPERAQWLQKMEELNRQLEE